MNAKQAFEQAYALGRSYVDETLLGGGAVVGKNVIISSIEPIENGNRVTFVYTLDDGTQKTSTMDVMNGEPGASIESIKIDRNENIVVTLTDGTTKIIGKVPIDVEANFLVETGFGNLRYYNGKFQKYDSATQTWADTAATPDNVIVVNMIPRPMRKIMGIYDHNIGHYKLNWLEPEDTIVDGQVLCVVDKVIIRRKLGAVPQNENDGDFVTEISRPNFGTYSDKYFIDETFSPSIGETYYYKAFPMSTTGFVNAATANETDGINAKDYFLFGFKIDQNESDPESMITYIEDNKRFTPVRMDYDLDLFDYGSWQDAWFMNVKPCMLKYDGTVAYELNPNDYTKKLDGTDSDVANENFEGNAMVGIPKVYWKIADNGDNTANIYISDKKLDDDFVCWSHIDNNGNEMPYCYMPIYNGYNDGTRLRSLSGKTPIYNKNATQEIALALANNQTDDVIWYTEVLSDRTLINILLLLIGKSTNTQSVFGNGYYTGGSQDNNPRIDTGTMNNKGLFWGSNGSSMVGVKVFGIEHWWGNQWRRIAGWINDKGTQKIKMTYGQSDGSIIDGYNTIANGYVEIADSVPSGTSGGYISKMLFNKNGLIPKAASGSATTYYTDGLWFNNSQTNYALAGGSSSRGLSVGALYSYLSNTASDETWAVGVAISCKPLNQTGGTS